MDDIKCEALGTELVAQPESQIVAVGRFFDGNDDLSSIGCNLDEHPGVGAFRDIFSGLLRRQDVQVVYAQIAELDPGDGCWPFTDTVLVAGTISVDDLRETEWKRLFKRKSRLLFSDHEAERGAGKLIGLPQLILQVPQV